MGDRVTVADCALYPMVHHNAVNFDDHFLTAEYPKLQRWAQLFAERESAECPQRDDGLREIVPVDPSAGQKFWWQKTDDKA
jgi:glutathione S-transferase